MWTINGIYQYGMINKIKGVSTLEQVTKQEVEWLLVNGYLKRKRGVIPHLIVTRHRRYVPSTIYAKLI